MIRQADVTRAVKGAIDKFRKEHPGAEVGWVAASFENGQISVSVAPRGEDAPMLPRAPEPELDRSPFLPYEEAEFLALQTGRA